MASTTTAKADLANAISGRRLVIVAGTGISIAASSHPQASWSGLLENGIEWLRDHKLMNADEAAAQLMLIKRHPQTHRLISAAEDITAAMGGVHSKHFSEWLKRTVGEIKVKDCRIINALHAIRTHGRGHLLATTNYDDLLLGDRPGLNAVVWQDADEVIGTIRDWNTERLIFLHGYWRRPESVILDWKSYDRITRDRYHHDNIAAFWTTNTWVYVGCGVNGLTDPDLGLLLERYGKRARQAGHWDYCLVRGEEQRQEYQAHFDARGINIVAVSYGENLLDLPDYLLSLIPTRAADQPSASVASLSSVTTNAIPAPPALYAEPDYIGSHHFIGRQAELQGLSDWANASDPTNLLLFEAIGGSGKSILTWEWSTKYATTARADWAGRFWYSFYHRGAIMDDFCQRALAYMTNTPLKDFEKRKTSELKNELVAQLHHRPWLLILDGLERVLVAYHRIDAAQVADEEVNAPTDKVLNRNPCNAIRHDDNDLLRALASCSPSKILISSRLTPSVLLNAAGQCIPGVRRITLPGLRPHDAENLLCSCGILGDSLSIQSYLRRNCDNHPLVIGVLAGLVANYLPNRGNFDAWRADPSAGAALDVAKLDLIQRRNHILLTAITTLSDASRQLLSTMALLAESVDYKTLEALNPHLRPEPPEVTKPLDIRKSPRLARLRNEEIAKQQQRYEASLRRWKEYDNALATWRDDMALAPKRLADTIRDLEQRGLIQYDGREQRYDLHPVVRGISASDMQSEERQRYGQRVIDHFSAQAHNPYEEAKTLEDLKSGLHVVRTLIKMGRFSRAVSFYRGDFARALKYNVEGYVEILSLLRPFFGEGWDKLPRQFTIEIQHHMAKDVAIALNNCGEPREAMMVYSTVLTSSLAVGNIAEANLSLRNISRSLMRQNLLARAIRVNNLSIELANLSTRDDLFRAQTSHFLGLAMTGRWSEAEAIWEYLKSFEDMFDNNSVRRGDVDCYYARYQFWKGTLHEGSLQNAERRAMAGCNRGAIRGLRRLRGEWKSEQGDWKLAAESFSDAVRMARAIGISDIPSETGLALAKFHLGQLSEEEACGEAERLTQLRQPAHHSLASLWLAIGDIEQAKHCAIAAYERAWADGEPYVHRYELEKIIDIMRQMDLAIPILPAHGLIDNGNFLWEADVLAAIKRYARH